MQCLWLLISRNNRNSAFRIHAVNVWNPKFSSKIYQSYTASYHWDAMQKITQGLKQRLKSFPFPFTEETNTHVSLKITTLLYSYNTVLNSNANYIVTIMQLPAVIILLPPCGLVSICIIHGPYQKRYQWSCTYYRHKITSNFSQKCICGKRILLY